jgi:hypothetical protein
MIEPIPNIEVDIGHHAVRLRWRNLSGCTFLLEILQQIFMEPAPNTEDDTCILLGIQWGLLYESSLQQDFLHGRDRPRRCAGKHQTV